MGLYHYIRGNNRFSLVSAFVYIVYTVVASVGISAIANTTSVSAAECTSAQKASVGTYTYYPEARKIVSIDAANNASGGKGTTTCNIISSTFTETSSNSGIFRWESPTSCPIQIVSVSGDGEKGTLQKLGTPKTAGRGNPAGCTDETKVTSSRAIALKVSGGGGADCDAECKKQDPSSFKNQADCEAAGNVWKQRAAPGGGSEGSCETGKSKCEALDGTWDKDKETCIPPPDESATSCNIDGIGWIICPVMTFMGSINELMYNAVSSMLEFDSSKLSDKDLFTAWSMFRNIANILFVIAFLVIIYAQMTGLGVTNYGIKRLLPKLIVAAVLVNVSFWICAIAVDVSNILGSSLKSFFDTLAVSDVDKDGGTGVGGVVVGGLVTVLLAGGLVAGAVGVALAISVPVLLAVALAIIMIIVILMARQALIILLIVAAPVAFVAYLLPNTNQWFKRWMKLFGTLLMLYPIIGVVFGASAFAARLVSNTATGDDMYLQQLTAVGIATLPLIFVPSLLKNSLSATGALGAKLSGMSGKANSLALGSGKKELRRNATNLESRMATAEGSGRFARAQRYMGGFRGRRSFDRKHDDTAAAKQQEDALATHVLNNPEKYNSAQQAEAKSIQAKRRNEEVQAAAILQRGLSHDKKGIIAKTGMLDGRKVSEAERIAAIQYTMASGNFKERSQLLQSAGSIADDGHDNALQELNEQYYKTGMNGIYGSALGDQLSSRDSDGKTAFSGMDTTAMEEALNSAALNNVVKAKKVKGETLASDGDAAQYLADIAEAGKQSRELTQEHIDSIKAAAKEADTSPVLAAKKNGVVQAGLDKITSL